MKKAFFFVIILQLSGGIGESGMKSGNLESLNDQFVIAVNNDMEDLSRFYFEDALLFHETEQPVKGIEGIRTIYEKIFSGSKLKTIQKKHR